MKVIIKIFLLNLLFSVNLFSQAEEFGLASFYSDLFQGKPTASGELYDKGKLTAAHKTYPFGTILKVTRLDNKKSVNVKVIDRGPFISGRVVEVSRSAARQLGLEKDGSAKVKVEVVSEKTEAVTAAKTEEKPTSFEAETPAKKVEEKPAAIEKPAPAKAEVAAPAKKETAKAAEVAKPAEATKAKAETPKAAETTKGKAADQPKAVLVSLKDYQQFDLFEIELRKPEKKGFSVQVAVLSSQDALFKKVAELQDAWFTNILVSVEKGAKGESLYKVMLGSFATEDLAQSYKASLKKNKKMNGFVVNLTNLATEK